MPGRNNNADPTKSGFNTEDEAWQYVFDNMCKNCKDERQRVLAGEVLYDDDSEYPACSAEWSVILTEEFRQDIEGLLMAAAGAVRRDASRFDSLGK
jgi:hypothetical protein